MSNHRLPEHGITDEEIFAGLEATTKDDLVADGHAFAFIYDAGVEAKAIARRAFSHCMGANGLDPTAYPSARRLENDLVSIGLAHLRAPEGAVGTATSGGTESVLLSVKTARDYSKKLHPSLTAPEMLVPETAHACFHKAAHYFGIELVPVAIDPKTMRADVADMRAKITKNTILLVASAPSYAHGVIDPITEIGALALDHGLLFHVDACIGGWVLPFEREIGVELPEFDFNVPGVSSISVDLHKYAFAPKGISLLLQRDRKLRGSQYYTCAHWTGYSVINTTTLSSKSTAAMGAAWALLQHIGREGYREHVRTMWNATQSFVRGIREIEGLRVVAEPTMGLVAITTEGDRDLFELADRVTDKGWHLQPTYGFGASPTHIHFSVDPSNSGNIPTLLADLEEAIKDLPAKRVVPEQVVQMIELMALGNGDGMDAGPMMRELGIEDGRLPKAQAQIHRLLDAISPVAREALLIKFFGELFLVIGNIFGRKGRPLRIAYGRIFHEGNAFSPLPTTKKSFEDFLFFQGEDLAQRTTLRGHELPGFLRQAELSGFVQAARLAGNVETIPLFSAMTVPSGPLTPETFTWLRETMTQKIRAAGPLDGIYLALHGSMQVRDLGSSPEGVLIADAKMASSGAPIAASFDLHGNLCRSIAEPLTVLTAYRTNPHRDLFRTGYRAGNRLIRALRGQIEPTHAWRKLPIVIGGGTTVDLFEPMRSIFRHMRQLEKDPRVLTAHLFMAHPFNDAPDLSWAIHLSTDGDQKLADELADELANRVFEVRKVPPPPFRTLEGALEEVKRSRLATKTGSISLVDVCDVVGAGSTGGNTHLLDALVRDPDAARVYLPVHDPEAVGACASAAIGSEVDVLIRGIATDWPQPAVPVHAIVAAKFENESGKVVRLDVGKLSLAVTERLPLTIAPRFWREIGLSPFEADAIVQKTFFHYRFFYLASNRGNIGVESAGPTSLDNVKNLPFDLPVWPMHRVEEWRSFDRARRTGGTTS